MLQLVAWWASNVLQHCVALLAGCGATVALGLIERYVLKQNVSLHLYSLILIGLFLFANYQAWRDEHQNAEVVKTEKAQFASTAYGLATQLQDKQREVENLRDELAKRTPTITVPPTKVQVVRVPSEERKPLVLLPRQRQLIRAHMADFGGEKIRVEIHEPASAEQILFGRALAEDLRAAGLQVELIQAMIMGGPPHIPGLSFVIGESRLKAANTLGAVLLQQGVVDSPVHAIQVPVADQFIVRITSQ